MSNCGKHFRNWRLWIHPHANFRLFFTSELNPKVGSIVFWSCRVILFKAATGTRANLRRIVTQGFSLDDVPAEGRRILLNFLWTHAIIMERIRYIPLGWNKEYEFNDSDF
jgi:dynein heavy chain 1